MKVCNNCGKAIRENEEIVKYRGEIYCSVECSNNVGSGGKEDDISRFVE
jgi:hypothetical protein